MSTSFVDLFCGVGGASSGFQQAGATAALGVDEDADVLQCWKHNTREGTKCETITPDNALAMLPPAEKGLHIHASAPCQLLSRQRQGSTAAELANGLRLFRLSVEIPLLRGDHTWSSEQVPSPPVVQVATVLAAHFPERVAFAILDACDYGNASSRSRLIIGPPGLIQRLRRMGTARRVCMAEAFRAYGVDVPEGAVAVTMSRGRTSPKNRPRRLDGTAFTVLASHPMTWLDDQGKSLGCLSWRHSAALMGFAPEWKFPKTTRAAQRAAGNAIPPPLAKAIMQAAMELQRADSALPPPIAPAQLNSIFTETNPPPSQSMHMPHPDPTHALLLERIEDMSRALDEMKQLVLELRI